MFDPATIESTWNEIRPRDGWDFSRLHVERDLVPWIYKDVVRASLAELERPIEVLDVGTGGGEKLFHLAPSFDRAIGIDPDPKMIQAAIDNTSPEFTHKFEFRLGDAASSGIQNNSVDCVLNRHAVVDVSEIDRVLRPGGVFLTQQVGRRNLEELVRRFGGQDFGDDQLPEKLRQELIDSDMIIARFEEYDVEYRFLDLKSVLFQIKAIEDYLVTNSSSKGFFDLLAETLEAIRDGKDEYVSNEHRWLIVARKEPVRAS